MNDWVDAEQHVERAHELYDAGRWDEAESELRLALSLNPYQPDWHFNLGLTLEASGRHSEAARAFCEAHDLHSSETNAPLYAAVNLIRCGRPGEALDWLAKAVEAGPESGAVAVHRIEAYSDLGRHEEAEEAFYLGQQLDPDNPDLYAAMADSLLDRGKTDKAVWCLREAGRLDPGLPRVQAKLAEAFAASGRLERARQLYLRELRADPADVDTMLDLGTLLVQMHRYTEAGEKFRRVLEIEPDHPDAHFSLGDLAERTGEIGEALIQFDVVLRLDSGYAEARCRLAGILLMRGRVEELPRARDLLRLELRDAREEPSRQTHESLSELGLLLLDADMPVDAAEVFRRVLELRPGDHSGHHHLSVALFEMGQVDRGMAAARQALVYEARFVPAMHNLALAHLRQKQWLRARYWVRQASRIDADDASLRRLRMQLRVRSAAGVGLWALGIASRVARRVWAVLTRPARAGA